MRRFRESGRTVFGQGTSRTGKSQSSWKIEVKGCPLNSASRKQKARAHSSGEAKYYAAASATCETLFMGLEGRTELLLDSAAACSTCPREGVGTIRLLSAQVLWLQQLVKRGVVTVGACTSAEKRADLVTKSLPAQRLRQPRQWNGLVLDRHDRLATGD